MIEGRRLVCQSERPLSVWHRCGHVVLYRNPENPLIALRSLRAVEKEVCPYCATTTKYECDLTDYREPPLTRREGE